MRDENEPPTGDDRPAPLMAKLLLTIAPFAALLLLLALHQWLSP